MQLSLQCSDNASVRRNAVAQARSRPRVPGHGFSAAGESVWGWRPSQVPPPCRHCTIVDSSRDYTRPGSIQPQQAIAGAGLPGPLTNPGPLSGQLNNRTSKSAADEALLSVKRYNTQRIKLCSDWRQLARVVAVHGHVFNTTNTCAALVHLAQLGPGPQQPHPNRTLKAEGSRATAIDDYAAYEGLLQRLLQMACSEIPHLQARQVANVMWAASTLSAGYTGGHPLCRDLLHQLLPVSSAMMPWSNAQELANSIWAVATAGLSPDDQWLLQFLNSAQVAFPQTSSRDLATMLWALRMLGVSPDEEWLGAYAARLREVAALPVGLGNGTAASLRSRQHAPVTHRDAAQVLAAMAHLGVDLMVLDEGLLRVLRDRLLEDLPRRTSPMGDLGRSSSQWGVSVSQGLWAMVRLGVAPPTEWTSKVFTLMESHLDQFGPQELSTSLWSLVSMGQPLPPSLLRAVYAATVVPCVPHIDLQQQAEDEPSYQLLQDFCPQSLAELIWAVAAADQNHAYQTGTTSRPLAPPVPWTRAFLHAVSTRLSQGGFSEQPTAMVLVSLARLGITPPPSWASAIISHVNTSLKDIGPQALTNSMWSLATMGFQVNPEGLQALEAQLQARLQPMVVSGDGAARWDSPQAAGTVTRRVAVTSGGWGSQELSNTLWVLAKWRHRPSDEVVELLLGRMRALCRTPGVVDDIQPQELTNALWSLGQLGVQPSDGWLRDVWGACVHHLRAFAPQDMAQLVHALAKLGRRPPPPAPPGGDVGHPSGSEEEDFFHGNLLAPGATPAAYPPAATSSGAAGGQGAAGTPSTTRSPVPEWVAVLLPAAAGVLSRSSSQDLSNLSWGLAQLGVRPGQAWCERLARELVTRGNGFSGGHLALCVWALGRMGYRPVPQSLLPLEGLLFRRMPSLAARELAACCCGFASMSYRPDLEWLEAYAAQCKTMAHEFTQHEWSTVLWSLARVVDIDKEAGIYLEDLFLSPQLAARMDQFNASGIAILTYACGMLGSRSPRLMGRLLTAAIPRMDQFSGQELAALITTCAGTGVVPDRVFFQAWAHEVAVRMQAAEPGNNQAGMAVVGGVRQRAQGFGAPLGGAVAPMPPVQVVGLEGGEEEEVFSGGVEYPDATSLMDEINRQGGEGEASGVAQEDEVQEGEGDNVSVGDGALPGAGPRGGPHVRRSPVLTPSMLAVSAWALAKLGFRPKSDWLQLYCGTLLHHGRMGGLGPRETHMATLALAAWERQVPYEVVRMLRLLAKQHKPLYCKAERFSINLALKVLRTVSTAPPHLKAQQQHQQPVPRPAVPAHARTGKAAIR